MLIIPAYCMGVILEKTWKRQLTQAMDGEGRTSWHDFVPKKMEEILVKRWCKKSNKARSFRSKKVKGWGYYPWFALICGFLFSKNWFTAVQNEKICKTIICMYWYIYIYIIHFFLYIIHVYIYTYYIIYIYVLGRNHGAQLRWKNKYTSTRCHPPSTRCCCTFARSWVGCPRGWCNVIMAQLIEVFFFGSQ